MIALIAISAAIVSITLFALIALLSDKFVKWKRARVDSAFWDMADSMIAKDDSEQALRWKADMRRLASLNALSSEKVEKLLELEVISADEAEEFAAVAPPAYSFNISLFAAAFVPMMFAGFLATFYSLLLSPYELTFSALSLVAIIGMVLIGMVDQKSHMIPFELALPMTLVAIAYVVESVLSGFRPAWLIALGFAVTALAFAAPYLLMGRKGQKAFGKGDTMLLPTYALMVSPVPVVGLVATVSPMLVAAMRISFRGEGQSRMPMGPFLAFGACASAVFSILSFFWL